MWVAIFNRSLFWTTLHKLSNFQYPTNYRILHLGSSFFWNTFAFSHAFRINHWTRGVSLSSENHYSVLQCTYEEETLSVDEPFVFMQTIFSLSKSYLGNRSSPRIAGSADQMMIKAPGGGARPSGRKMKRGTARLPHVTACHDTAWHETSHQLQPKPTFELITEAECSSNCRIDRKH